MALKLTLAAARVNVGLTQRQAAAELNVSRETIGKWENGKVSPTADKIDAICTLYRVAYDNLIFFKTNNA